MLKVVLFFIGVSIVTIEAARTACTHDSQCGAGECCYYHEGPLMVSRKRAVQPVDSKPIQVQNPFLNVHQGGYCETYKLENQPCSMFGKMNGHCECAQGLTCNFVSDSAEKRDLLFPGYGSYMCVKSQ